MVAKFCMCKRTVRNFISFLFINNQGKQHNITKKYNVHRFSYKVKKQFSHINGRRVLTVNDRE